MSMNILGVNSIFSRSYRDLRFNDLFVFVYDCLSSRFHAALEPLSQALVLIGTASHRTGWETTLLNTAHCYRKLKYSVSVLFNNPIYFLNFLQSSPDFWLFIWLFSGVLLCPTYFDSSRHVCCGIRVVQYLDVIVWYLHKHIAAVLISYDI